MIADKIRRLTKRLYPTGRAWNMPLDSFFGKLHEGLNISEITAYESGLSVLNQILPDNANFTIEDAVAWEIKLRMVVNSGATFEERKSAILRKIRYPGTIKARQHYLSVQRELRSAGFDVYVHENSIPLDVDLSGGTYFEHSDSGEHGPDSEMGLSDKVLISGVVANQLIQTDEDFGTPAESFEHRPDSEMGPDYFHGEETFATPSVLNQTPIGLRSTFFVGGPVFGEFADVDAGREKEFRHLILMLKPTHTICFLLINYI